MCTEFPRYDIYSRLDLYRFMTYLTITIYFKIYMIYEIITASS